MPPFSPYWVTVPLGLLMFSWVIYEVSASSEIARRTEVITGVATIPNAEKGMLDFGAGIEEALNEFNASMVLLGKDVAALGRLVATHTGKISAASSFTQKRDRAIRLAGLLERRPESMEPRIMRMESSTDLLSESFVGFVEINNEETVLRSMKGSAAGLGKNIPVALNGTAQFHVSLQTLQAQRIQQHLTAVAGGLEQRIGRMKSSFETIQLACSAVLHEVTSKGY